MKITVTILSAILLSFAFAQAQRDDLNMPMSMEQLDDSRKLEVGDRMIYQVLEDREDPIMIFVDTQGKVDVPLVGKLTGQGKTSRALANAIKADLEEEYYYRATPVLRIRDQGSVRGRISLLGEVAVRGMQPLPADEAMTMSRMILRAGGQTPDADLTKVRLVRELPNGEDEVRKEVDIAAIWDGTGGNDPILEPGDVIIIPRKEVADGTVTVMGAVGSEGEYKIPDENFTVSKAILMAGGLSQFANGKRVRLIRNNEQTGERNTTQVNVSKVFEEGDTSEDPEVKPGDIIIIKERWINF
ncbi:MAG: polysaccharide biosynthesis/export family protein [Verrucomicrobiota bacterium]